MDLTECRQFFERPATPSQRQYEALRAYFIEGLASPEVARRFGYTPAALLRFPRSTGRFLRREADRTAAATQEGQAPRYCRRSAQAQLLDLRHKPCAQRTGNAAWHDRGAGNSRRRRLRAFTAPPR